MILSIRSAAKAVYTRDDGTIAGDKAWLVDFVHPERNDFLAVNQFTVIEANTHKRLENRRPDIVLFVGGLPLAVIELKNAGDENATTLDAFRQMEAYKQLIPSLFRTNTVLVASDGTAMQNPTLLILTDRNDLDDQLFGTFSACKDLLRQKPQQADSRETLRDLLNVSSGGVVFATIQKFLPSEGEEEFPCLSKRSNIVVIADEAHRSQYGLKAKLNRKTGAMGYGFAKHMRDALPNASFIGFTGTPIEKEDVNTPAIFGDYIDVYDIERAVRDGATVPIYYESRLAKLELEEETLGGLDQEIDDLTEEEELSAAEKQKSKWSRVEALVGAEPRLKLIAADIVRHFENRLAGMDGKGMIVCMSRRICVALYNEIISLRPDWHSDEDTGGVVKVVMTGNIAKDPKEWLQHTGSKKRRDDLAVRARDPKDPLKLVIVRDMWLTGFDAPCMHTMYVDKPIPWKRCGR